MKLLQKIDTMSTFQDFVQIKPHEMTLLGSPVLNGEVQDTVVRSKISYLKTTID